MSFEIKFLGTRVTDLEPGQKAKFGRITIGSFSERFLSSLNYWSMADYHKHWQAALRRIVDDSRTSCLITSMHDPKKSKYIFWRPMYRIGRTIYVQDQILFLETLPRKFDETNPFVCVRSRQTTSDEGEKISEWSTSVEEVKDYLSPGKPR